MIDKTHPDAPLQQTRRKPQARSLERRRIILESARSLLESTPVNELSLYQVADKAGIPPSSVYHFFPKVDVLLDILVEDIFSAFEAILDKPLDAQRIRHWPDIILQIQERYIAYYREHKYVRDLIFGQQVVSTIRHADYLHDDLLGCRIRHFYEQFYQLPPLPGDFNIFAIALQIADKVYSISHQKFGNITDVMAEEGVSAATAYLASYLPRKMLRSEPVTGSSPI